MVWGTISGIGGCVGKRREGGDDWRGWIIYVTIRASGKSNGTQKTGRGSQWGRRSGGEGWCFEAAARRYIIFVSFREEMAHAQLYNSSASFRGKPLEKFSPTINENILFLFLAAIKSTHELQNNNIIYNTVLFLLLSIWFWVLSNALVFGIYIVG